MRILRALEAESDRLRKLLVNSDLEIEVMQEINKKSGERTGPIEAGPLRHRAGHWPAKGLCADAGSSPLGTVLTR